MCDDDPSWSGIQESLLHSLLPCKLHTTVWRHVWKYIWIHVFYFSIFFGGGGNKMSETNGFERFQCCEKSAQRKCVIYHGREWVRERDREDKQNIHSGRLFPYMAKLSETPVSATLVHPAPASPQSLPVEEKTIWCTHWTVNTTQPLLRTCSLLIGLVSKVHN